MRISDWSSDVCSSDLSGSLSARSRSRMSGSYVNAYVWPSGAVQSSRVNSGRYSFSRAQNLNVLLEVTRLPSDWTLADWISSIAAAYSSRPSSPKLYHHGSFDLSSRSREGQLLLSIDAGSDRMSFV